MHELSISEILTRFKKVAVVGISRQPFKISRQIAEYLEDNGFEVVGVNPAFTDADGIKVYPKLQDIPGEIDIVNVFMRSENIPEIIDDVIAKNPKVLWLQSGIRNDEAVKPVISKGIITIQDRCIMIEHQSCL